MTTTQTAPQARRRVRVTIEADAAPVPTTGLLRLHTGQGIAVIDPNASNVTVEEIAPGHDWTDKDVVQRVDTGRALYRSRTEAGEHRWFGGGLLVATMTDAAVSRKVAKGEFRILRYQAGEQ